MKIKKKRENQEEKSDAVNEFFFDLTGQDGTVYKLKGRLVRNHVMTLESIIIVRITEKV